jgi:exodeoxyribonuclease VII small subunit
VGIVVVRHGPSYQPEAARAHSGDDVDERPKTGDHAVMSEPRSSSKGDDKSSDPPSAPKMKDEPFEQTLARLEKTLERLEKADLPLEEALTAYEEGLRLVKSAQGKLDSMDARLEQLLENGGTAPLTPPSEDGRSK